jgi:hypothetical protein
MYRLIQRRGLLMSMTISPSTQSNTTVTLDNQKQKIENAISLQQQEQQIATENQQQLQTSSNDSVLSSPSSDVGPAYIVEMGQLTQQSQSAGTSSEQDVGPAYILQLKQQDNQTTTKNPGVTPKIDR